jgi:uncharacterized membrane protein YoaK (UPF0700 family)
MATKKTAKTGKARAKKTLDEKVSLTPTIIENALVARKSSHAMGSEFLGATALSFIAGYVDTAGYLALFGLFTAHITGDLITAAAVMVHGVNAAAVIRLLMLPVFMATIALTTILLRSMQRRGAKSIAPMLALMTLALAAFAAAGYFFGDSAADAGSPGTALIAAIGVAAMGIQNAMMRGALKSFSPTTVMTGNLAQFTIDLVELVIPLPASNGKEKTASREKLGKRLRKSGLPLLGFTVGAFLGAWLTSRYGLLSIALPALISAVLTVMTLIRSRAIA